MITIDITLLIHVINMFVLMAVLNAVLYKPIQAILAGRDAKRASLQEDVERFEENARHRQEEVERKMREAGARAKSALEGARSEAQAAGNEKLAAIRAESDSDKSEQLAEIRNQFDAASKELQEKTRDFATEMAEKILGRSLEA